MSQRAYSNLDAVAQEALALNQLYITLPVEMKCQCLDRGCKTVLDAVDVVERYEALMGDELDKKKVSS